MSKRLQVLLDETELRAVQRAARGDGLTVAEWVRGALRVARCNRSTMDAGRKHAAVRVAARHAFPTGDIGQMLAEIEQGYAGERP